MSAQHEHALARCLQQLTDEQQQLKGVNEQATAIRKRAKALNKLAGQLMAQMGVEHYVANGVRFARNAGICVAKPSDIADEPIDV